MPSSVILMDWRSHLQMTTWTGSTHTEDYHMTGIVFATTLPLMDHA